MKELLPYFIYIPLIGFLLSFLFNNKNEKQISGLAIGVVGLQAISIFVFAIYWVMQKFPVLDVKHFVFYKDVEIEIFLSFYFDAITLVFALLGAILTLLVVLFSKYYMHREEGYKRFFSTILLFYLGYNITVFSGNFETLFIGWEFLGMTSFLLIAFYRDRYLPIKNALKTVSLYRFGDVCLMLALWMSHHTWHQNITFMQFNNTDIVSAHIAEHYTDVLFIVTMLIVAAAIKSAQFPFSSWLPRAMEGPTTSSAIFYGSLSVHLGVFLLMRTYAYWHSIPLFSIIIIMVGAATAIVATLIARVQSTVKTQIAYSSIAQIGLMFIEVAMGWHVFALIHLCGNAFLRTYQLLVSPSVLGYLIHDQFFSYHPKQYGTQNSFASKVTNSIYLLSIKEWNLNTTMKKVLWNPLKWLGKQLQFLQTNIALIIFAVVLLMGAVAFYFENNITPQLDHVLHLLFSCIGMLLVLSAFANRKNAIKAWLLIILSQMYNVLAIALLNDDYGFAEMLYYSAGVFLAALIGLYCLWQIKKSESHVSLDRFYGYVYEYPGLAFWFLLACLAFIGLPFTPSFIGIDLLFSHIHKHEYALLTFTAINFLVVEIAVLRIYARIFLGQHIKQTHPIAYKSS
jgi:NADH:ubiquinone oxidoreductase subunit 5 (subunit L)/multisubunit Na+/H+ antiporter MnhA subunit